MSVECSVLKTQNLVLGYFGKGLTKPFTISLKENSWYGIIGSNGTGKSTFIKTILGGLKPVSGRLEIRKDISGKHNSGISYIPQERDVNLNDLTSGYSLIMSSYRAEKYGLPCLNKKIINKVSELLEIVGADDYVRQPYCSLSGGQKKRIFLVQALINDPKLLLLDEPLADLDPVAKQSFIKALQSIHSIRKMSLLMISHDMHEIAENLDEFIHFKDGMVHLCEDLPCIKESAYVGI